MLSPEFQPLSTAIRPSSKKIHRHPAQPQKQDSQHNTSCDIMRLFFPNLAEEPGRQVLAGFANHQTIPLGRQFTERNQSKIHK